MPPEGALDDETRTLLYLASALAAGSAACIQAMANKAKMQGIPAAKILETVHIVRFRAGDEGDRRSRAGLRRIAGDAEIALVVDWRCVSAGLPEKKHYAF